MTGRWLGEHIMLTVVIFQWITHSACVRTCVPMPSLLTTWHILHDHIFGSRTRFTRLPDTRLTLHHSKQVDQVFTQRANLALRWACCKNSCVSSHARDPMTYLDVHEASWKFEEAYSAGAASCGKTAWVVLSLCRLPQSGSVMVWRHITVPSPTETLPSL